MRVILIALLAAISYAQTELGNVLATPEVSTSTTPIPLEQCSMSLAEMNFRMWDHYSCEEVQSGWGVCTDETDPNHALIMANCPATCCMARGDECSSPPLSQPEIDFRMWDTYTCQDMQTRWKVCTNEADPNHDQVMENCPRTCAIARNFPCPIIEPTKCTLPTEQAGYSIAADAALMNCNAGKNGCTNPSFTNIECSDPSLGGEVVIQGCDFKNNEIKLTGCSTFEYAGKLCYEMCPNESYELLQDAPTDVPDGVVKNHCINSPDCIGYFSNPSDRSKNSLISLIDERCLDPSCSGSWDVFIWKNFEQAEAEGEGMEAEAGAEPEAGAEAEPGAELEAGAEPEAGAAELEAGEVEPPQSTPTNSKEPFGDVAERIQTDYEKLVEYNGVGIYLPGLEIKRKSTEGRGSKKNANTVMVLEDIEEYCEILPPEHCTMPCILKGNSCEEMEVIPLMKSRPAIRQTNQSQDWRPLTFTLGGALLGFIVAFICYRFSQSKTQTDEDYFVTLGEHA